MHSFAARYGFVSALNIIVLFVQLDMSLFVLPYIVDVSTSMCIGLCKLVSVDGIIGIEYVLFAFHIYIYFIDGISDFQFS